jgi:L-aminopeptidase/D-esterase-like protein
MAKGSFSSHQSTTSALSGRFSFTGHRQRTPRTRGNVINGTLTDVMGLEVGHHTDLVAATGCTVVVARNGAVGGVDVRGSAPGTRETDLLRAENMVENVHAITLAGGSAYGLAAATGVMRYLEGQGIGHKVRNWVVPIVPAAIIFDLGIGDSAVRPTDADGHAAAESASDAPVEQGSVGAGTGATVGKVLGPTVSMKGGVGSASMDLGNGVLLAALAVVNAVGSVHDPDTGALLAGPLADGKPTSAVDVYADPNYGRVPRAATPEPLSNTTIAVIGTSLKLTKSQANRLATVAHDGLALAVRPTHTLHDGDTVFALATGVVDAVDEFPRLCALAPTVMANAIVNAIRNATSLHGHAAYAEVNHA